MLETTFSTDAGTVRVIDSLNQSANGLLPWAELARDIRAELAEGPLLYRFTGADKIEGTFVACSFWLIDALVRNGHKPAARKLWRELAAHTSELGLLAEEIDPDTGAFLGNLPQGLSHLALLNAAALLDT
ncbi:MAG TPA: glycoside hydrolase family 15 protein [Streptosporangiaceae bacterium]|nr:glycoside hydrolase family 15 protein [Streptosporangiaceae bacterium]